MKNYLLLTTLLLAGCQMPPLPGPDGDRLTLGTVQRQIRVGMTNAQVTEVLGAPNMVNTDEQRREVWVYDRVSTDSVGASNVGGVNILILGFGGSSHAESTSQRTITIIVKYDESGRVRDFAYRSSSF